MGKNIIQVNLSEAKQDSFFDWESYEFKVKNYVEKLKKEDKFNLEKNIKDLRNNYIIRMDLWKEILNNTI